MILSLIVAASENDVIGKAGGLPWHLSDDFKHFRAVTEGKPVIMGRKTYESIGKPLPKRQNIVISREVGLRIEGCDTVTSLDEAIECARNSGADESVIIGGAQIYTLALPLAQRLYFTRVHTTVEGDTFMPTIDWSQWNKIDSVDHPVDEKHAYAFTMETWERTSP